MRPAVSAIAALMGSQYDQSNSYTERWKQALDRRPNAVPPNRIRSTPPMCRTTLHYSGGFAFASMFAVGTTSMDVIKAFARCTLEMTAVVAVPVMAV
jgi:hypothetical protein